MSTAQARVLIVLACFLVTLAVAEAAAGCHGVVVEEVAAGGAAAKGGIEAGDVLLTWSAETDGATGDELTSGSFRAAHEVGRVETAVAVHGSVTVRLRRGSNTVEVVVPAGRWQVLTRPCLSPARRGLYLRGRPVAATGAEATIELWSALARDWSASGREEVAFWIHNQAVHWAQRLRDRALVEAMLDRALELAEQSGSPELDSAIRLAEGGVWLRLHDYPAAQEALVEALSAGGRQRPESKSAALQVDNLGLVAWYRGQLRTARTRFARSLAMRIRLLPDSACVARSYNNLGVLARRLGDLDAARSCQLRSLAILERLLPDTTEIARTLTNLGLIAQDRGDLATAEARLRAALTITTRLDPGGMSRARQLGNLGLVAMERGDLANADQYFRRALEIQEREDPEGPEVALSWMNLGSIAVHRRDLDLAAVRYGRALELMESIAPGSQNVAALLINIAAVEHHRGDLERARGHLERALAVHQSLGSENVHVIQVLAELGNIALKMSDLAGARAHLEGARRLAERSAPSSLAHADVYEKLGVLAAEEGDATEAEALVRSSLEIRERLAPDSEWVAGSCYLLGHGLRQRGERVGAAEMFARAVDALEAQAGKLGGSHETRAGYGASFADYYRDYIQVLLELDRAEEAFHVLERSRAQVLRQMLAERDLVFRADIPDQLSLELRAASSAYEETQRGLHGLTAADGLRQRDRLLEARRRVDEVKARIRAASPRLAALQYPEPLRVGTVRQLLDPGTLLLAYSLGEDVSHLFALGPGQDEFTVLAVDTTRRKLSLEVDSFRRLVMRGRSGTSPESVRRGAANLSTAFLAPVQPLVERANRVVILPDGPLYLLPFATLIDAEAGSEARWLVEGVPITVVSSATVLADLVHRRRQRVDPHVVAFGDPTYPRSTDASEVGPHIASLLRHGQQLEPLPATRTEVSRIAALYPGSTAAWLGESATEERAKSLNRDASVVHFACHAFIDELFPLESALLLSIPSRPDESVEDGLLKAWEIFETVRVDADLVTLSACETALGRELAGEGILGLTRAFHYAGARSVLASLWSVGDVSTAVLMSRFYEHLRAGAAKDEALRRAQVELIEGPIELTAGDHSSAIDASHPFFWSAFQLIGDWR
jgi:CHAT domain-containing protein/tetratricopeptide (TPR) repeat protein